MLCCEWQGGKPLGFLIQGSQCQEAGTGQEMFWSCLTPSHGARTWGQDPVPHRERKLEPVPHRDVHQQVEAGKDAAVGEGLGNLLLLSASPGVHGARKAPSAAGLRRVRVGGPSAGGIPGARAGARRGGG